jgi:hypothetical protein
MREVKVGGIQAASARSMLMAGFGHNSSNRSFTTKHLNASTESTPDWLHLIPAFLHHAVTDCLQLDSIAPLPIEQLPTAF